MIDTFNIQESNFMLYAAKNYSNPQCYDIIEFEEDLKRFKYIKRLLNKYIEYGELKERLILNHIISLNNVFGPTAATKMMFFKLQGYESFLAPFLFTLGTLPDRIYGMGINNTVLNCNEIHMDINTLTVLKEI